MLKKFFRRKPDGSTANDGSFRSPPGPAPYQPAVPREAGSVSAIVGYALSGADVGSAVTRRLF
eukprot:2949508-Rhodomonas_salina.1